MKKKRTKILVIVASICVLAVVGIFLYQKPVRVNQMITICTVEGETKEALVEGTWYRYLLAPTKFAVDGKKYTSSFLSRPKLFEEIKNKFEKRLPDHYFCSSPNALNRLDDCFLVFFDQRVTGLKNA